MISSENLQKLIKAIIEGQSAIIGPMAIDLANRVAGLSVSKDLSTIQITLEGKSVLNELVKIYEKVFGQASIEVCRDVVKESSDKLSEKDLPAILK